jgi:hypothetical protein
LLAPYVTVLSDAVSEEHLSKFRIKFDHEEGIKHCFYPKHQQRTPITIGATSQKQAKNLYRKFSFQIKEKVF